LFSWSQVSQSVGFRHRWRAEQPGPDRYELRDASGFRLASVDFRDDLQRWSFFGHSHLTSDEARRIAKAIARLPEFLMQRVDSSSAAAVLAGSRIARITSR
jgi:hypothetical protein